MKKRNRFFGLLRKLTDRRLFVAILLLLQIVLLILLLRGSYRVYWLETLLTAISVVTALHLLTHQEKGAFKVSLVFLILLLPVFGGAIYWLFHFQTASVGIRKRSARIERRFRPLYPASEERFAAAAERNPEEEKLIRYLEKTAGFPVCRGTDTRYFGDGKEMLERLLNDLRTAKKCIYLEYFIIEEGVFWDSVLEVLRERVAAGVDVRMIYDDVGCLLKLPANYAKRMRKYGIRCQIFNPFRPFLTSLQNNRDHRKITVIDGVIAYTGGINLADEYINERIRYGHWKDCAIRLEGDGAYHFYLMFLSMWNLVTKTDELPALPPPSPASDGDGWIQPYTDSPIDREDTGEHVFLHMISSAKKTIWITTPYLMLDEGMLSALKLAAKSGIDVRIVTPYKPDKKLVHFTSRSYYRELIHAGVRIYEYQEGFIHAKVMLTDGRCAVIGSTNMDYRSLYLHFECGVCLYRTESVRDMEEDFRKTLEASREIRESDCKASFPVAFFRDVCRLFAPLM